MKANLLETVGLKPLFKQQIPPYIQNIYWSDYYTTMCGFLKCLLWLYIKLENVRMEIDAYAKFTQLSRAYSTAGKTRALRLRLPYGEKWSGEPL